MGRCSQRGVDDATRGSGDRDRCLDRRDADEAELASKRSQGGCDVGAELDQAASSITTLGGELTAAGLSPGTTGNLSVRLTDGILCTPTGVALGALDPARLSRLDRDGHHRSGPRPTKESVLHAAIYAADPSIGAVIHLHAPYVAAVSCLAGLDPYDAIPAMTPYLTMRAGPVAVVPYAAPGSARSAAKLGALVARGHRAILMANHGCMAIGGSLSQAASIAYELEQAAMLHLVMWGLPVRRLSASEVSELRRAVS